MDFEAIRYICMERKLAYLLYTFGALSCTVEPVLLYICTFDERGMFALNH